MVHVYFLVISMLFSALAIIGGLYIKNIKKHPSIAYYAFTGGIFVAATALFVPIYTLQFAGTDGQIFKTFLISVHNTMRLFVLDGEFDIIKEYAEHLDDITSTIYPVYAAVVYVLAPILTFGVVLSFFKTADAYRKYICAFYKDAYIFSELNEKSLALAQSIQNSRQKCIFVFTDFFAGDDERSFELQSRARLLGAVCFKQDILFINWGMHSKKKQLSFFIIGGSENEKIVQTKGLTENYNNRENTSLYLFSSSTEGELTVAHLKKGKVKVRRINEARSVIRQNLYTKGEKIFDTAYTAEDGIKEISAVIIGLSDIGKEMLKGLSWLCQMDGYRVIITAFDEDKKAESILMCECPELLSDKVNGKKIDGESEYLIKIHDGITLNSLEFVEIFNQIPNPTYVLTALEGDSDNIKQAVFMRMLLERRGLKNTIIQACVEGSQLKSIIENAKNFKGEPYNIDYIGDIDSTYSDDTILKSKLEEEGLKRHLKYSSEAEEFWNYEYNYQSSIALAIHMKMRIHCNIPGAEKSEAELSIQEREIIERLEHRRWNAYVRSEGYVYSGNPERNSRNDLGKMHSDLRPFNELTEKVKRLDSIVGTK